MLGENTQGLSVPVHWEKKDVEVKVQPMPNRTLPKKEIIGNVLSTGILDKSMLSKQMGFTVEDCKTLRESESHTLVSLFREAGSVQNKYTRLLKGCLIVQDCKRHGKMAVGGIHKHIVQYTPRGIAESANHGNRAYMFTHMPKSVYYNTMLVLMAGEYPTRYSRCGDVFVPSDARENYLVTSEDIDSAAGFMMAPSITAELALAAVIEYAVACQLTDELQSAMVTACSLLENRYLTQVSLPKVVSKCDLILPAFSFYAEKDTSIHQLGAMTAEMSIMVGRLHQMSCLTVAKDTLTAAQMSSRADIDWMSTANSMVMEREGLLSNLGNHITDLPVLRMTPQLKWLTNLDQRDYHDILQVPVFESLWITGKAGLGVSGGALHLMKKGFANMESGNAYVDFFLRECKKAGVVPTHSQIPRGAYTIEGTSLSYQVWRPERVRTRKRVATQQSVPCNTRLLVSNELPPRRTWKKKQKVIRTRFHVDQPAEFEEDVVFPELMHKPLSEFQGEDDSTSWSQIVDEEEAYLEKVNIKDEVQEASISSQPSSHDERINMAIEQVLAAEATGKPVKSVRMRENIRRPEWKEEYLAQLEGFDKQDFDYVRSFVERALTVDDVGRIMRREWNRVPTSPGGAMMWASFEVDEDRDKSALKEWAIERNELVNLCRLSVREFVDEMAKSGKIDKMMPVSHSYSGVVLDFLEKEGEEKAVMPTGESIDIENTAMYKASKLKSKFDGDPLSVPIDMLHHIIESKPWKKLLRESGIEVGKPMLGKSASETVATLAQKYDSLGVVLMLAQYLNNTEHALSSLPVDVQELANLRSTPVPTRRGESMSPPLITDGDARLVVWSLTRGMPYVSRHLVKQAQKDRQMAPWWTKLQLMYFPEGDKGPLKSPDYNPEYEQRRSMEISKQLFHDPREELVKPDPKREAELKRVSPIVARLKARTRTQAPPPEEESDSGSEESD